MRSGWAVRRAIPGLAVILGFAAVRAPGGGPSYKPPVRGYSHIYVRALDVEKTYRFYHHVLGMHFVGAKKEGKKAYYYFESGGVRICVGGFPGDPSDYEPRRNSSVYIHLEVDELDAMYERIRKAGYMDVTDPRTALWGGRTFTVYDPNGVALGMTEWVGKSDWQERDELDRSDPFPAPPAPTQSSKRSQ